MSNTFLKILAGIAALAVLAGIFYVIIFHDFTGGSLFNQDAKEVPNEQVDDNVEKVEVQPEEDEIKELDNIGLTQSEIGAESLKRMASSFAERFGSYSNHSSYSNILYLKIFMTDSMKLWADNFVEEMKTKEEYSGIYYGITTKAVSAIVEKFDDDTGRAEILVETQRRESTGEINNVSVSYQNILISFLKEGNSWKVSQAEWQ